MATQTNPKMVVNVGDKEILDIAEKVKGHYNAVAVAETNLNESKEELLTQVKKLWEVGTNDSAFPKNYKMDTSLGVVQAEVKVMAAKAVIEESFKPNLTKMFGPHLPSLFQETTVVDQVVDKAKVLDILSKMSGLNLNDIEITIKNPALLEDIQRKSKGGALTCKKVLSPVSGFLDAVGELPDAIIQDDSVHVFLKELLERSQQFAVVCGNRGKK